MRPPAMLCADSTLDLSARRNPAITSFGDEQDGVAQRALRDRHVRLHALAIWGNVSHASSIIRSWN